MEICRFVRFFPTGSDVFGGNWSGQYNISIAQKEFGNNIEIISGKSFSKKQSSFENINGLKINRVFSSAPSFLNLPYIIYGFNAVAKFNELKKSTDFDLVHAHNEDTFWPMVHIKKKTSLPVFYHCHLLLKAWDVKGLLESRKKFPEIFTSVYSRLYYEKIAINNSDMIFAYSEPSKQEINELYNVPLNKIHVILNGTNPDIFKPFNSELRQKLGFSGKDIVLFIPDVGVRKGFHELIPAFRKLSKKFNNIKLLVAGGKKEELRLKFTDKNIIFAGMVPYNQMAEYYNVCDIFVLPTKYEGLPKSLLEAMSCEKIVVATKVNGIPAVIDDGKNGFLLDIPNEEKLVRKLSFVLTNYNSMDKIKKNARKTILKKFTLKDFASRIDNGYKKFFSGDF